MDIHRMPSIMVGTAGRMPALPARARDAHASITFARLDEKSLTAESVVDIVWPQAKNSRSSFPTIFERGERDAFRISTASLAQAICPALSE